MINKCCTSVDDAVADIHDGAVVMVGGFGPAGQPEQLLDALIRRNPKQLTLISNNAGNGDYGLAALLKAGCVKKVICSFPRQSDSWVFDELYRNGDVELELVPQGNLAARIQAGGSGLGAIFTPTGYGTELAAGKETREIDGRHYVLEMPLKADFALIKGRLADRWGNMVYEKTGRNFGPIMAMAARCTIAQVGGIARLGELDPEGVITPGIFVQRVVSVADAPLHLTA
ncbi:3-oxoadipate CoA-transferase subunit A [Salmonella enterica subsp. enterica serovar Choleraesuis]|nr:3-oxoadipate CoA-transferase subunit A [Salmonella enterica subsp. enterica serovar Choleraesuis]